jgi:hypothetical protein
MATFMDNSAAQAFVAADAQQYFVSPLFLGNDVLAKFDVMTDIKGNTYLDHFSAASKLTVADNGAAFSATNDASAYTNPQISPKRVEAEIAMNGQNFFNKVKGQILRSGTSKDNVDGTLLKKIGSEILMQGIMADFNRQVWFGDTNALVTGTGSGNYNVYDGGFASMLSKLADAQIVAATYSGATEGDAIAALKSCYDAATAELKELPKTFYVSGKIADDYVRDLTAKGVAPAYVDLQNGISGLSYLGIPIVVRRDWDTVLANDYALVRQIAQEESGGTPAIGGTALGARIALIADNALVVGTDMSSASVESWYNKDQKEFRFRFGYLCGSVLLDAKLAVLYGN